MKLITRTRRAAHFVLVVLLLAWQAFPPYNVTLSNQLT